MLGAYPEGDRNMEGLTIVETVNIVVWGSIFGVFDDRCYITTTELYCSLDNRHLNYPAMNGCRCLLCFTIDAF